MSYAVPSQEMCISEFIFQLAVSLYETGKTKIQRSAQVAAAFHHCFQPQILLDGVKPKQSALALSCADV